MAKKAAAVTARGRISAWRDLNVEEINGLAQITVNILSEINGLRSAAKRVIGKIPQIAEKMTAALETDAEDRSGAVLEALEKKHGPEEALAIYDSEDYPEFERLADAQQRDEESVNLLMSIEVPDTDDPTEQAIEALKNLQEGLEELLVHFRNLK